MVNHLISELKNVRLDVNFTCALEGTNLSIQNSSLSAAIVEENDDDKEKKYNPNGRESKQIGSTAVLQQEETNTSLFTKKNSLRYTTKRQR